MAAVDVRQLLEIIETQNEIIATELELGGVMRLVANRARALTDADAAVVELADGEEMVNEAVCGTAELYPGVRLSCHASLSGLCLSLDQVLRSDDTASDPRVDRELCARIGAVSILCAPIRHEGSVAGVLKSYSGRPDAFDAGAEHALELLAGLVSAQMTHASRFEADPDGGQRDPLTQLFNRRAYDDRLVHEAERARRYDHPVALVLLDVDGFREVNERLGHPGGDAILRGVGAQLAGSRYADAAFRIGGDEFAVLLPETDLHGAEAAAERLAASVAEAGRVTISWGAAAGHGDPLVLHERADWALLASKERGPTEA